MTARCPCSRLLKGRELSYSGAGNKAAFRRRLRLVRGEVVALDGTKMRAVASAKNIAGAERLARDIAHTEDEIAYYLDRLDIMDDHNAQGLADRPIRRKAFDEALGSLERRKARLVKRQIELARRDEKVLVFGEPEARPMGYGRAPKLPSYNLQSVVDVGSGLIVHHDVFNDANDSHMLHPMAMAAREVLAADTLHVLADGGYSNAEEVARCEREAITVSAPIKRGAMNSEHFRPSHFVHDEVSDTIRCPAGQTLRPSGKHSRNRAIRYRTSACKACVLKPQCTPGAQRTIHRLIDQGALDRMEARICADPSLMRTRRCTVEHPFGTIKRMTGAADSSQGGSDGSKPKPHYRYWPTTSSTRPISPEQGRFQHKDLGCSQKIIAEIATLRKPASQF